MLSDFIFDRVKVDDFGLDDRTLQESIDNIYNTRRTNGDPFDLIYRQTSLKAFKDLGIDFEKYSEFIPIEDLDKKFRQSVGDGFDEPISAKIDLDFENISQ